jgi:MFS family permease
MAAFALCPLAIAVCVAVLDGKIANVAIPTIAQQMHAMPYASIWVVNAYQFTVLPSACRHSPPRSLSESSLADEIRRAGRRSRYRLRKQVVEPIFGQENSARGFRQFLIRSLAQVRGEWVMICTVHNLLKLSTPLGH